MKVGPEVLDKRHREGVAICLGQIVRLSAMNPTEAISIAIAKWLFLAKLRVGDPVWVDFNHGPPKRIVRLRN